MNTGYEEKCFEFDYNEVKSNNGIIYLVKEDEKIIGLIIGVIKKTIIEYDYVRNFNVGEDTELIVTKNIRAKGIEKQLLEKNGIIF